MTALESIDNIKVRFSQDKVRFHVFHFFYARFSTQSSGQLEHKDADDKRPFSSFVAYDQNSFIFHALGFSLHFTS